MSEYEYVVQFDWFVFVDFKEACRLAGVPVYEGVQYALLDFIERHPPEKRATPIHSEYTMSLERYEEYKRKERATHGNY